MEGDDRQAAVQDDRREAELRELFKLSLPTVRSRSGVDAVLGLPDATMVDFELKSTTDERRSVSTVRDMGPDHFVKWRSRHWLFGFYDREQSLEYCLYGSPALMEPWIATMERYVLPDVQLAELVPELISTDLMIRLLGDKHVYSYDDARRIHKNQWKKDHYIAMLDVIGRPRPKSKLLTSPGNGYSRGRMLALIRERCEYLIRRGATLNNPHIPGSYFADESLWPRITKDHVRVLRRMVQAALAPQPQAAPAPVEVDDLLED